jgi:NitT/TauT family transport system ATP-binding protein
VEDRIKLEVRNVAKSYIVNGELFEVIQPTSFGVQPGEFLVILGPSGCGKTTLLRMIAGLEEPSAGEIFLNEGKVSGPSRERGMVFQSFTSFPWLSVAENIAFGLTLAGTDRNKVNETTSRFIEAVGLRGFETFYPKDLSGGMKQRVAIARTLANEPELLLMDEPFGSLDAQTRWQMQELLLQLRTEFQMTVVYVTHDIEEAIFLGDRVCMFSPRPTRLIKEHGIPFGLQRERSIKTTKAFLELEAEVSQEIRAVR